MQINEKYKIISDSLQYIIQEKRVVRDEQSKNFGKVFWDNVAYCGRLEQVRTFIFENEIKADLSILENIDKCIELKNQLREIEVEDETK